MQIGEYMNVVSNSINSVQMTVVLMNNSRNVPVELLAVLFGYCWLSVFCTKNNLIDNLTITTHNSNFNDSQRLTLRGYPVI